MMHDDNIVMYHFNALTLLLSRCEGQLAYSNPKGSALKAFVGHGLGDTAQLCIICEK